MPEHLQTSDSSEAITAEHIQESEAQATAELGVDVFGPLHQLGIEITSSRPLTVEEQGQVRDYLSAAETQTSPEAYTKQIDLLTKVQTGLLMLEEYELVKQVVKTVEACNARRENLEKARESGRLPEAQAYGVAAELSKGPELTTYLDAKADQADKLKRIEEARTRLGRAIATSQAETAEAAVAKSENQLKDTILQAEQRIQTDSP